MESSFSSSCILNISTCLVRLLRIFILKLSGKFSSLAWLTDLDVDWLTLALPLDMVFHVSQIYSNDNWYTSPLLMRSRRLIHSSPIVLRKRFFSVLNPKWCSFALLTLYMNLFIRPSRISSYFVFILQISSLRSWSLYFSRNTFCISLHDIIESVPKLMNHLRALSFNVAKNNLSLWFF